MGKDGKVWAFNLPAIITCTPTKWCLAKKGKEQNCYALKGNYKFPKVQKSYRERLELSKKDDFVERMIHEIDKRNPTYFRFHSSGDFYSEEYVKKVIEIAENSPDVLFRTTTRRRDLTKIIQELNSLPNFIVRESLDTERTTPKMNLPFAALSQLDIVSKSNSYECKNDCPKCGYYCWGNSVDMHFIEH